VLLLGAMLMTLCTGNVDLLLLLHCCCVCNPQNHIQQLAGACLQCIGVFLQRSELSN
jgi:hypothetical protein